MKRYPAFGSTTASRVLVVNGSSLLLKTRESPSRVADPVAAPIVQASFHNSRESRRLIARPLSAVAWERTPTTVKGRPTTGSDESEESLPLMSVTKCHEETYTIGQAESSLGTGDAREKDTTQQPLTLPGASLDRHLDRLRHRGGADQLQTVTAGDR